MSADLFNLFSVNKSGESRKVISSSSIRQDGVYNEESFRYLLQAESKRSQRSGHVHQILLVCCTDRHGAVTRMDSHVAGEVLDALSQSLRETDYVGWYREGRIVGGVLTVVGQDSVADLRDRLQPRLREILQDKLGVEESRHLLIRLCQPHELNGIEFGEEMFAVD